MGEVSSLKPLVNRIRGTSRCFLEIYPLMISGRAILENIQDASVSAGANRHRHCDGFTLIELIVVIALLGLMLFFSLPRLQNNPFIDERKKTSRWLINKFQALKESAIRDQKQYSLIFDLDSGRIWETHEAMSQEELETAALNNYDLPENVRLIDIEYPDRGKITTGQTEITFYKAGYTDKAYIHMQEDETYLSFLIEPFLPHIQVFEKYAAFGD